MMTFRIYRQRLVSKLQPAHWLTALLALLISFTLVSSPLFANTDSGLDSEQGIEAGADAAADTVSSPESTATNDAQPDEIASDPDNSGSAEPERELTFSDESSTSQTDVVDSSAITSGQDSTLLSPDGLEAEVEPIAESDAEQLEFFYLTSPQLPTTSGIRSRSMSGPAAPYIEARVELFPPCYAYAPNNPSLYGFKGEQWGHIAEYGFTAAYNSVSISQGYDGNDWLYGVTGRFAEEAEFAANSTIHCMQPGLAPPCPGGDNVRFITMNYMREIFIGDSPYYLYWGMSKFYYDPDYAYTEEGQSMGFYIAIPKSYSVDVLKVDIDSHEPLSDTEFTLLRYPVTLVDGWVTTDVSTISADDPAWQAIGKLCTDQYGRVSFSHLGFGYYQVIESRPNPLYRSYRESGGTAHFQLIDRDHQQPIMQYFEDDKIEIGVEVYKDTVNVTSAAFATDTDDYLSINNIDKEIYHYNLYFRSTSNVRADEFTVVDPLENVASQQVRVIEVFTPVAWGDSDGLFNLWYQTNYTDGSKSYSDVTALGSNPDNPNNPNRTQVWPSLGWQLWQANIPTTSSSNLKVVDLGLAADEYITALRFEYGSVEVGFTTLNGPLDGLQSSKSNKPTSIDWTPQLSDSFYAVEADEASGLKPATYLVSCPSGMLPPTTISSSVTAHIARNVVLYDDDYDDVVTTVIEPFKLSPTEYQPLQNSTITSRSLPYGRPITSSLPQTDDSLTTWLLLVVSVCLVIGGLLCLAGQKRKRAVKEE